MATTGVVNSFVSSDVETENANTSMYTTYNYFNLIIRITTFILRENNMQYIMILEIHLAIWKRIP